MCEAVVLVADWALENPGSSPHPAVEAGSMTLGYSIFQRNLPDRDVMRLNGREENNVVSCIVGKSLV